MTSSSLRELAKSEEIVEENPPAEGSRRAVDLTALDTFIEFKRRTGSTSGLDPESRVRSSNSTTTSQQSQAERRLAWGF